MRILLVDDSRLMRRYVARTLEMTGIGADINEAGNGREAMDKAHRIRPDLIITDLNMPEMNGEELVARLTADPDLSRVPVLILSADRSAARFENLIHTGAVGYLTKPVSPEELRIHLLELMGERL